MSEVINLRQARKRAARTVREEQAAANRAKFSQTKAERAAAETVAEKRRVLLDGAKLDDTK